MSAEIDQALGAVRAGRVEAYAVVMRRYQQEVWRIVAFALRDIEATEDLVQRVFIRAYFKLDGFEPGGDFGAWVRAIARNLVREELRRGEREERRLRVYHQHLAARLADDAAAGEREERLRAALADCRGQLSGDAERALAMRYEQDLGFETIARELGRTVAAARQMLARVRLSLRQCIEEKGGRS